jgi:hypothetical protein
MWPINNHEETGKEEKDYSGHGAKDSDVHAYE